MIIRATILTLCGAILGGCVGTAVDIQPNPLTVRVRRLALFYRADIPEVSERGVRGYSGAGDEAAIRAAVDAAVKAAMRATP